MKTRAKLVNRQSTVLLPERDIDKSPILECSHLGIDFGGLRAVNDFNLTIPRYVDNFEKEDEIDLNDLLSEMKKTDDELEKTQGEFLTLLRDLTSTDDAIMKSLDELIAKMEG